MKDSKFSASLFNVSFTPDTSTLHISINGVSDIYGNVTASLEIIAYGFKALKEDLNPCEMGEGFKGMCPMQQGLIQLESHIPIEKDVADSIPRMAPSWLRVGSTLLTFLLLCQASHTKFRISTERRGSW
jgi:hypothetical protein